MPNQSNFRSDIITPTDPRFFASRIIRVPTEGVLLEELPASFGYDPFDNAEIHFYSIDGNNLMLSLVVGIDEGVFKLHIVKYADGTSKTYLRMDLTKIFEDNNATLLPGDYRVAINFFSDEIGSYNNKKLYIEQISPSRKEIQLAFTTNTNEVNIANNEKELKEFVEKSFNRPYAVGVAEKIFVSGVQLNNSNEGVTYSNVVDNINLDTLGQTYDNTIAKVNRLGMDKDTEIKVNNFLVKLYESIKEEIIIKGDRRIQENEYRDFITQVVKREIGMLARTVDSRIKVT